MAVNDLPRLVNLPHPLTGAGRQVAYLPFLRNETLGGYLKRCQIEVAPGPLSVLVNHRQVSDWRKYRLRQGDYIEIRAVVRGGGGGGKLLRTVAMIALVLVAPQVGVMLAATLGISATTGAALVMIGGAMLINALLPPPIPQVGGLSGDAGKISPTYALSGARNQARQFAPMPLVIGRHKIVPDLAGKPFTEFVGQDQYLYQTYHFGLQPGLALDDFRIGDTPLASYQDVQLVHADAAGKLPAIFGNVNSETGREVRAVDGWVVRGLPRDTIAIGVDLQGVAYYGNDEGGMDARNISCEIQYRRLPEGTWQAYGGDKYGQYVLPGNGTNPVRRTLYHELPLGQYELRIRKTSGDVNSAREKNDFAMASLRSYRNDQTDYTGQRRVALKVRASSQLNGVIEQLSAVAAASCPVWTGSGWEVRHTTNPAWWFLWFSRGGFDAKGRRLYGAGLPDGRIELEAIKAWAAWCDAKKLSVSMVLDRECSTSDVLNQIARCGRGRYTWQTGRLGVIWDAADLPVTAVFGPSNIRPGSFRIEYANEKTADEVIVNFVNPEKGFQADQVRVGVPGVLSPTNPVSLDFVGCCDAGMAGREANLIAASQIHHRRRVSWESDIEGLVATRGDVVLLSHDLASWSYSGRLLGGSRGRLQLDKAVPLGANAWVGVRFPDGRYSTYRVRAGAGESDALDLRDLIPADDAGGVLPVPDESDALPYDWMWFYDVGAQPGRRVKIVDVKPSQDNVRFIAIDDVPAYYAAESGDVAGGGGAITLPPALGYLRLSESSRLSGDGRRVAEVSAVWPTLRGAISYELKHRRAGGAWSTVVLSDSSYSWVVDPADIEVMVTAAFSNGRVSAPVFASLTVRGHTLPPPAATAFVATGEGGQISLRWLYPERPDLRGVQLFASMDGGNWFKLVDLAFPTSSWVHVGLMAGTVVRYQLRVVDTWGNVGAAVEARGEVERNPAVILDQLKGGLTSEQLQQSLREPLERLPDIQSGVDSLIEAHLRQVLTADELHKTQGENYAFAKRELRAVNNGLRQEATDRLLLAVKVGSNTAAILNESTVRADQNKAMAETVSALTSTVNGQTSTIKDVARVVDGVLAEKVLKVSAGGKVAGFGLRADANGSAVDFLADRFAISLPDGNGSRQVFVLGSVNGRPVLVLAGDLVADGSLVGRRVLVEGSVDAAQINSRGLTIRDMQGNIVADMNGMGAAYIKGQLSVGQIDTRGLTIKNGAGQVVVDMSGMDAAYIRNLQVDTMQIKGEAVTKADTRTISSNGWVNSFDYSFNFYCSDSGTMLVFAELPPPLNKGGILYARDRAISGESQSALIVLNVSAGESVRVGCRGVPQSQSIASIRYGCVLFRR
ncbi:hypothetical protein JW897_06315 [Chromobacterium alkanivorans]|uniref:host specificity protein J n=1 Tax=Chromobacterium alkanivorans TaxID=1071719 RepID=UPI001967B338|nr:host specificity factor TipJ family phage tail protein [Chromobacterium alkanivorans]MBN3003349.1 hypothetical protein [Chromobacterium alkanivorans]